EPVRAWPDGDRDAPRGHPARLRSARDHAALHRERQVQLLGQRIHQHPHACPRPARAADEPALQRLAALCGKPHRGSPGDSPQRRSQSFQRQLRGHAAPDSAGRHRRRQRGLRPDAGRDRRAVQADRRNRRLRDRRHRHGHPQRASQRLSLQPVPAGSGPDRHAGARDTHAMRAHPASLRRPTRGFSLVEMIVVVFLLALAMLGILSVFDASARINKNEQDIADAQGAVRYGIYTMTRAIRMAGAGGLFVTQAVLNHKDPQLPGINVVNSNGDNSYDNIEAGTTVSPLTGDAIPVRPGTDMIEVRGVINSPLLGFDPLTGCEPCTTEGCASCQGTTPLNTAPTTQNPHARPARPTGRPFSQIAASTAGAGSGTSRMMVLVAFNDEVHASCTITPVGSLLQYPLYPQPSYNVGTISTKTTLAGSGSF